MPGYRELPATYHYNATYRFLVPRFAVIATNTPEKFVGSNNASLHNRPHARIFHVQPNIVEKKTILAEPHPLHFVCHL